ncbi:MAG: ABC transporter transmembrane domain-containing protein, partial [Wenzhouxiangella sp.]
MKDRAEESASRWLAAQAPSWLIPATGALALLQAGAIIAQAWLIARIIARAVIDQAGLSDLAGLLIALLAVLAARTAVDTVRGLAAAGASSQVRRALRPRLFERLTEAGPRLRGEQGSGALATTMIERVDLLDAWYARYLPQSVLA